MRNPLEKVSEVGDVISRAVSVASSKRETILRQSVNGVLLFIILLVFGCLDFATLTFHAEYLTTWGYWGTTITKTIAGICAFNIGINLMWDIELRRDYILAFAIRRYEILIHEINKHFEYFVIKVYNRREKKKAYISQINRKIYLLNKFSRAKSRLLYSSELPEHQALKEKNFYCRRRAELEKLKSDEFIDKNIDALKVNYLEVDPAIFQLEIDGSIKLRGTKTKGNVGMGKVKATGSMVFGMVGFSMFVTAFGITADKQEFANQMERFWHYLLKCAEDVGIVLWQVTRGLLRAKKIISSELTQPYAGRNKVLTEFVEWELEQGYIDQDYYNNLMTELKNVKIEGESKDEEYIEVTEEQLKKMKGDN